MSGGQSRSQSDDKALTRRALLTNAAKLSGAGAVTGLGLVGCGSTSSSTSTQKSVASKRPTNVTISFWVIPYGTPTLPPFLDKHAALFKEQTGITVDVVLLSATSSTQKWNLAMANGSPPDVGDMFYLQSRIVQGRSKWGPLDITSFVDQGQFGDFNRFVPVAQREAKYKNRIYAVPWRIDIRDFVYNAAFVPTAPTTLDDFAQSAQNAYFAHRLQAGSQTIGGLYDQLKAVGACWGVEYLSGDLSRPILNDPRWLDACKWTQSMIKKKVLLAAAGIDITLPPFDNFVTQQVSSLFGGNESVVTIAKSTAPQVLPKIRSAGMPIGPAGQSICTASSGQFAVMQNSPHQAEGMKWIQYLTSPAVISDLCVATGTWPADEQAQSVLADSFSRPFFESSKTALGIDQPSPAWAELSAVPSGAFSQLTTDIFALKDPKTALATAQSAAEGVLARYA